MEAISGIQSGTVRENSMPSVLETYLCKEPWERTGSLSPIDQSFFKFSDLERLRSSLDFYSQQARHKTLEHLQLEIAKLHMRESRFDEAYRVLFPLWRSSIWRSNGWWWPFCELAWALRECAFRLAEKKTLVSVEWELLHQVVPSRSAWDYHFPSLLDGKGSEDNDRTITLSSDNVLSCLSVTFAFASSSSHVGLELPFQITLTSMAHRRAESLSLSRFELFFSGVLRDVRILHSEDVDPSSFISAGLLNLQHVETEVRTNTDKDCSILSDSHDTSEVLDADGRVESLPSMISDYSLGSANLSMPAGGTKVFSLQAIPREPGQISLEKVVLHMEAGSYRLAIVNTNSERLRQDCLYTKYKKRVKKCSIESSTIIDVMPKPPKVKIQIANPVLIYYTDEVMYQEVIVTNDEEVAVDLDLIVAVKDLNGMGLLPDVLWELGDTTEEDPIRSEVSAQYELRKSLGKMDPAQVQSIRFHMRAPRRPNQCILDIEANYTLSTDKDTHIRKLLSLDPDFTEPFAPKYEYLPEIQPDQWPSSFSAPEDDTLPSGITQRWVLKTNLKPTHAYDLTIEDVALLASNARQDIATSMKTLPSPDFAENSVDNQNERRFEIDVQKIEWDDRRNSNLDLEMQIRWRRKEHQHQQLQEAISTSTTIVAVPRLSLSFGEPRVLVAQHKPTTTSEATSDPMVHLVYMLENPSVHLLTFDLTMEADEGFAFSGPKATNTQLVPMSRHTVLYSILPFRRGVWIKPNLKIVDVNFNQTLKVLATGQIRQDNKKGGVLVWTGGDENKNPDLRLA